MCGPEENIKGDHAGGIFRQGNVNLFLGVASWIARNQPGCQKDAWLMASRDHAFTDRLQVHWDRSLVLIGGPSGRNSSPDPV
jgi:hypothetical protein